MKKVGRHTTHAQHLRRLPDVMNVRQMSDFLGISTKTGYKLLSEGQIRHIRIGRVYKIPKRHLITYLNSGN